jgi:hypothetical protein
MAKSADGTKSLRRAAEQAGLLQALKLFPDAVKAAIERGSRPLGVPPNGTPPLLHPAPVFDPVRFETKR